MVGGGCHIRVSGEGCFVDDDRRSCPISAPNLFVGLRTEPPKLWKLWRVMILLSTSTAKMAVFGSFASIVIFASLDVAWDQAVE